MYGCYEKATECYPKKQRPFSLNLFFPLESLKAMNQYEIEQNQGMNNHFGGSNSPRVH